MSRVLEDINQHLDIMRKALELLPLVRENDIDNDGLHKMIQRHRTIATEQSESLIKPLQEEAPIGKSLF